MFTDDDISVAAYHAGYNECDKVLRSSSDGRPAVYSCERYRRVMGKATLWPIWQQGWTDRVKEEVEERNHVAVRD